MKKMNKYFLAVPIVGIAITMGLTNCTKTNHECINCPTPVKPTVVANTDTLNSVSGTATLQLAGGAAWDGTIEGVWSNAPALTVHAAVPNVGNGNFDGYVGNATDVTLQSMHDANNIYFLVQFNDDQENATSTPWYFNPTQTDMTKKWAMESTVPVMNADGYTFRKPFQQDGFAFMFNISDALFNAQSCYALCHVNSGYGSTAPAGAEMYTMGPSERTDTWRARLLQIARMNQASDCFFDDGSAQGQGGGLNIMGLTNDNNPQEGDGDGSRNGSPNNVQTLTITGTTLTEDVPMWVIPAGTYSNSVIMAKDTLPGGAARKVTAVDSNGVLTYSGGTIDPRSGTDYQQVGEGDGPKCPAGAIVGQYTGSRGDVTCNAFYTGSGWKMLYQRALKTSDNVRDVDFSSLSDQPFGIGVFFDGADNEHAIVAGLILHFK